MTIAEYNFLFEGEPYGEAKVTLPDEYCPTCDTIVPSGLQCEKSMCPG